MHISEFQALIKKTYGQKDKQRSVEETFVWFIEEIGELARAFHRDKEDSLSEEFADCLAWLVTLANLKGIELEKATIQKYKDGCYRCHSIPCQCVEPKAMEK